MDGERGHCDMMSDNASNYKLLPFHPCECVRMFEVESFRGMKERLLSWFYIHWADSSRVEPKLKPSICHDIRCCSRGSSGSCICISGGDIRASEKK